MIPAPEGRGTWRVRGPRTHSRTEWRWRAVRSIALVAAVAMPVVDGCSTSGSARSSGHRGAPASVPKAAVTGPVTAGKGIVLPGTTTFDLASVAYEQHEYFISGTATGYTSAGSLTGDGRWRVTAASTAPYTTRMVVYRPTDPAKFNGTVIVEWLNVTGGLDAAAAWLGGHVQLIRSGAAYVGVSAQAGGVVGVAGSAASAAGQGGGVKAADAARYGSLRHPGDTYSFSIFEQAGAAIVRDAATVLGGLVPARVIAVGESQSAFRLVTYINAIEPQSRGVYDAYLVYSRGGGAAPLSQAPQPDLTPPTPTFIRTDLHVPVLLFETESDVLVLGYLAARQPATPLIREWESAGTSHFDTYGLLESMTDNGDGVADARAFDTMIHGQTSAAGGIIHCSYPLNAGAHTYELRAALAAIDRWVSTGAAPPQSSRLEVASPTSFVTDENGEAVGGIRTPHVAAPIAVLSGVGQPDTGGYGGVTCAIFGRTTPFSAAKLSSLYPTHADFVQKWEHAVSAAVAQTYLLPADAKVLDQVAGQSTIGR